MSFYRERFGHREGEFPVCEDVAARSLALPFFPAMSEGQVERVAKALREALGQAPPS
jgi:perosamine synthetase